MIKDKKFFVPPDKLDKDSPLQKDGICQLEGRYLKDYCYISGCSSQT